MNEPYISGEGSPRGMEEEVLSGFEWSTGVQKRRPRKGEVQDICALHGQTLLGYDDVVREGDTAFD